MTDPITQPGWYKARPEGGLEWVCGLGEDPGGETWDLVRVEVDSHAAVEEPLF